MDLPFKLKKLDCGINVLFVKDNSKDLLHFEIPFKLLLNVSFVINAAKS